VERELLGRDFGRLSLSASIERREGGTERVGRQRSVMSRNRVSARQLEGGGGACLSPGRTGEENGRMTRRGGGGRVWGHWR